jgi:hypothetical protein
MIDKLQNEQVMSKKGLKYVAYCYIILISIEIILCKIGSALPGPASAAGFMQAYLCYLGAKEQPCCQKRRKDAETFRLMKKLPNLCKKKRLPGFIAPPAAVK